jgi:hypothetical protein
MRWKINAVLLEDAKVARTHESGAFQRARA